MSVHRISGRVIACIVALGQLTCIASFSYAQGEVKVPVQTEEAAPSAVLPDGSVAEWFDARLPHALNQADIAGAVVVVVQDGRTVFQKGYGSADIEASVPMDPQTSVLSVASVTKLATWAAVMREVELGRIDLDADVTDYIDLHIPDDGFAAPITMRHLMTHTAGFEEQWARRASADGPRSLRDYLHQVASPERIYRPGSVTAYSNYGVLLAAYVVESTSGLGFADYLKQNVLGPAGMHGANFEWPQPDREPPRSVSYYETASRGIALKPPVFEPQPHPAGGLFATGEDMGALMHAYLQPRGTPLSNISIQAMYLSPELPEGAAGGALGFWRYHRNNRLIFEHTGDGDVGEHAIMMLLPEENAGLFMAFNSMGRSEVLLPAAFTLRPQLRDDFLDRFFPDLSGQSSHDLAQDNDLSQARLIAGGYRMTRRSANDFMEARDALLNLLAFQTRIRALENGDIETAPFMTFSDQPQRWKQAGPFVWRAVDGDSELRAIVRDGRVDRVVLTNHPYWAYEPIPALKSLSLNFTLLAAALAFFLSSTIAWPVRAFVQLRRRQSEFDERSIWSRRAQFLTQIGLATGVIYLAGWLFALATDVPGAPGAILTIRLLQAIGLLAVAGWLASIANLRFAFSDRRGPLSLVGACLSFTSLTVLVWFSFAFHLISFELRY